MGPAILEAFEVPPHEANSWSTGPILMKYRKNESIFEVDHKYVYKDNIRNSHIRIIQQIKLKSGCIK